MGLVEGVRDTALLPRQGGFVTDFGSAMHAATVVIGDKLGLYAALAERGPITGSDLAQALGFDTRLVEEWLAAQFVSGYAEYDPTARTFWLTEEQAAVLADDSTPAFLVGAQTITAAMWKDEERIRDAFRSGKGVGWHEHSHDLFHGTEKLFKPGYLGNLVSTWIPALDEVDAKLRSGAKVADIGCGHGSSTILLAKEYPKAEITGFDYHAESIDQARRRAREAGIGDRSTSRSPPRRTSRAPGTNWCASSTHCTTWVTPSAPPPTSVRRSPMTAPGCSSSRWPSPDSRTT